MSSDNEGPLSSSFGEPSSPPRSPNSRTGALCKPVTQTCFTSCLWLDADDVDNILSPYQDERDILLGNEVQEEEIEGEELFGDNLEKWVHPCNKTVIFLGDLT